MDAEFGDEYIKIPADLATDGAAVELVMETQLELEVDLNAETLTSNPYTINLPTGIKGTVTTQFTFEKLTPPVEEETEEVVNEGRKYERVVF